MQDNKSIVKKFLVSKTHMHAMTVAHVIPVIVYVQHARMKHMWAEILSQCLK